MTNSKFFPGAFIAVAALLSGLTVATAQTSTATAPVQVETTADEPTRTRADFRKGHSNRGGRAVMGQFIEQIDTNGDRAVTQAEIDLFRSETVENADTSGEGDITLNEFETIYGMMTRNHMIDAFQNLDADGDGVVTQTEMDARFGSIVERLDRNDDGQLDREDRPGRDQRGEGRDGARHGERRG